MLNVSCQFSVPLGRFLDDDYIRNLNLSVVSWDEQGKEIVLGKISGDLLLLGDIENDGADLFEVCDADSQGMYDLYEALFSEGSQFRPDLDLSEPTENILFLWQSVLHEKVRPYQQAIIDIVGGLFGTFCVVVMWRDVTQLSDKQLADLGFARIAGTRFVFRHNALVTAFGRANPRGIEVPLEFEASPDDQTTILNKWQERDHPRLFEEGGG